jgi:predicted transcriptional regulator
MSPSEKRKRRIRTVLDDSKNRLVLSKIYFGFRPAEIARQLGMSAQNIKYYTSNLMDLNLINKEGDKSGITWKVTERGLFILKQFIIQSVDYHTSSASYIRNKSRVPIRLNNICFAFKIYSSLEDLRIQWESLKNGVCKHTIVKRNKEQGHTIDIIKSPNQGNSIMLVHMNEQYSLNIFRDIIKLYDEARVLAVQVANELQIFVSNTGELIKRPHLAFEDDLIALYLATFETASTNTCDKKGKAWIDASHGLGELETNDPEYALKYLTMPESVFETHKNVSMIKEILSGHKMYYDPVLTHNN